MWPYDIYDSLTVSDLETIGNPPTIRTWRSFPWELRFHLQVCICATLKTLEDLDVVASPSDPENPQISDQHPIINQQHFHPKQLGWQLWTILVSNPSREKRQGNKHRKSNTESQTISKQSRRHAPARRGVALRKSLMTKHMTKITPPRRWTLFHKLSQKRWCEWPTWENVVFAPQTFQTSAAVFRSLKSNCKNLHLLLPSRADARVLQKSYLPYKPLYMAL